jgi:putative FmdB family regulatory protein
VPIYEYKCNSCGNRFEKIIFNSQDEKDLVCEKCGKKNIEKLLSSFSHANTGLSMSSGCSSSGGFS